ncbi:hypothetical protein AALC25_19850 [Lachnospiraceae bacterium 29-84]
MNNLKKELDKELADVHFHMDRFRLFQEPDKDQKKPAWNHKKICVTTVIAALALFPSGAGIYAGINYFQQRGSQLSQYEQDAYVEDMADARVNADTYSRELTKEERLRKDELMGRYLNEGLYPEKKLKKISSPEEAQADRVCFLPETSTFYLPERALSDEDLLEIIDHDLMIDYSLAQREGVDETETARQKTTNQKPRNTNTEQAIAIAKETVAKVYGEDDLDSMRVETEEVTDNLESRNETISDIYISFTQKESNSEYFVNINPTTGSINHLELSDEHTNYADNITPEDILNLDRIKTLKEKARLFIGGNYSIQKGYVQLIKDPEGYLPHGTVSYYFETTTGRILHLNYSEQTHRIFSFWNISQNEFSKNVTWAKEKYEKDGYQYELIEINQL